MPAARDLAKTYTDLRPEVQRVKHQVYNLTQDVKPQTHLHSLFFQQAAKTPAAPIYVFGGLWWAWQPANTKLRRCARPGQRSCAPVAAVPAAAGELVAVYLHKGWRQVVAALGILAAGGAYVPWTRASPWRASRTYSAAAPAGSPSHKPACYRMRPWPNCTHWILRPSASTTHWPICHPSRP